MDGNYMEKSELLAIAFDAALTKVGQSWRSAIGKVSPILVRLALIALFLWYIVEFLLVLLALNHWFLGGLLAVTMVALIVLFIGACGKTKSEYDKIRGQDSPAGSPVGRYFYAVLLPVLAVLISTIWNVQYSTPLLRFTQRIFEVLSL
jgi:hypothetical protein